MAWTVGSNQTCKAWAKETEIAKIEKSFWLPRFGSTGSDNIIQIRSELSKGKGDTIYFYFLDKLTGGGLGDNTGRASYTDSYGAGVSNIASILGHEPDITYYEDAVKIAEKEYGIRLPGRWWDQQTQNDARDDAKSLLGNWAAEFEDKMIFNHFAGLTTWLFPEAALAPTTSATYASNRKIYGGDATSKATIGAGDYLTCQEINRLKALAAEALPKIEPVRVEGGEYYVMVIHPRQMATLRNDQEWKDAHYYAADKGLKNPIFSGSDFIYNGVVVYVRPEVYLGTDAGGTGDLPYARALFLGRSAGCYAKGKPVAWHEDVTSSSANYGKKPGIMVDFMFGFKKSVFNSIDYGCIVCDTYAPQPAGEDHE